MVDQLNESLSDIINDCLEKSMLEIPEDDLVRVQAQIEEFMRALK